MTSEMILINVTPQAKALVERLSKATGESQKKVVDVIFSTLDGPADETVLSIHKFRVELERYDLAKAKAAIAKLERPKQDEIVKTNCTHCGALFRISTRLADKEVKCTKCGRTFVVALQLPPELTEIVEPEEN